METVTVRMARGDRTTSWGFGVTEALNKDVIIVNVVSGSLADRAGLRNGDILDELEGLNNLDINAVDRLLVTSRDKIEIVVHRNASGQARIWRPDITENSTMNRYSGHGPSAEERPYRVSLEHSNDSRPPQSFNSSALPFNADPRVKHLQYNSPIGLYSNANVAEQYAQQTAGIVNNSNANAVRQSFEQPVYLRSETLRLLKEEERNPRGTLSTHPNPSGLPSCFVCGRPILGVMARAAGHDLHGDCLSCSTCGNSLRNVGHHFIDEKFYCDVHGRQKKGIASIGLDPTIAVKSSPTAAHPIRPQENVRAFYQPDILSRRPLSVSPTPGETKIHIHHGTPKTQGTISPSNRGIPSSVNYGVDRQSVQSTPITRPVNIQTQLSPNPPPVPANPPPESRVPFSVRPAVSPRRSEQMLRQWPPPKGLPINRYWQIDPLKQCGDKNKHEHLSLSEMIIESEKEQPRKKKKEKDDISRILVSEKKKTNTVNEAQSLKSISIEEKAHLKQEGSRETPEITIKDDSSTILKDYSPHLHHEPILRDIVKEPIIHGLPQSSSFVGMNLLKSYVGGQHLDESQETMTVQNEITTKPQENSTSLIVPSTTDSSTSPIPIIHLTRRKSDGTSELSTRSHVAPSLMTPTHCDTVSQPELETVSSSLQLSSVLKSPPIHQQVHCPVKTDSLIIEARENYVDNTTNISTLYNNNCQTKQLKKPLKKVDFSKATVIPDNEPWVNNSDIVDEVDILTETSQQSESPLPHFNNFMLDFFKTNTPYDGDESELCDNKSDIPSTLNTDIEDEQELWIKEELEIARKEELAMQEIETMKTKTMEEERVSPSMEKISVKEEWRKHAMELLNDESQNEKDLAIVATLNKRLQGLRELKDDDRQKAIECIEQHQRNLEEQQEQLSTLLDSAIIFLKNFDAHINYKVDTSSNNKGKKTQSPSLFTSDQELGTESLSDVIQELENISILPVKSPNDFILSKLSQVDDKGQSYLHSSSERLEKKEQDSGGRLNDTRGQGSLTNPGGRIPYCEACKQQIRGAFVLATGLAWCPEHFVCANKQCGRRLLECGFVEENGSKYCENCFEAHIAPRCAKCAKPIISDCLNALQKKWHPTCFTCAHCQKPFGNSAFYLEQNLPYCEHDWNTLFTTKCVNCRFPIEAGDRWVEALGSAFHSNCFNCTRCHANLEGESFFAKNGQPFCKMHA